MRAFFNKRCNSFERLHRRCKIWVHNLGELGPVVADEEVLAVDETEVKVGHQKVKMKGEI